MRRNRTREAEATGAPRTLDPNQLTVLEALLAGSSITDAAAAVGVSRTTVHRWLKDDFLFRAEVNSARHTLRQTSLARLDVLCERSIEVLAGALNQANDTRVALEVLKGCGVLGGDRRIGTADAELLKAEEETESTEQKTRFRERLLFNF
jgi:AcrR family transcriptional regulator